MGIVNLPDVPSSLLKAQLAFASSQTTEKVKRKTPMARVFMVLSSLKGRQE